jgi:hypothetical protein
VLPRDQPPQLKPTKIVATAPTAAPSSRRFSDSGLALVGTACAVGYRNMFGGSVWPTITQSFKAINERNTIPSASYNVQTLVKQ